MDEPLGDFPPDAFREMGHAAVERLARYFETLETRPVLARTKPGEVLAQMPRRAPEDPEPWEAIERDLDRLVEPNLTHWQHPGYFAYFAITGSAPGDRGRLPRGGLQPGRHPLAHVARPHGARAGRRAVAARPRGPSVGAGRLRRPARRHGLDGFAHRARGRARGGVSRRPQDGPRGPAPRASSTARSSRIPRSTRRASSSGSAPKGCGRSRSTRSSGWTRPPSSRRSRKTGPPGRVPVAVVATAGTTTVTSVDPLPALADLCEREGIWLHVDAAYAGSAAALPEMRPLFAGWERADSVVFNPHKWMLVPLECTALFFRQHGARAARLLRRAELSRDARGTDACASTWITACSSAAGSAPSRCG